MEWICCASGRSLVASAMAWNSDGWGFSLMDIPTAMGMDKPLAKGLNFS